MDPVSSHAPPLPRNSALSFFFFLYLFNKSTISNSFLLEGLKVLLKFTTLANRSNFRLMIKPKNSVPEERHPRH